MIPFRIFHREKKEMFIVINYQDVAGGNYLAARQSDSDSEGELLLIASQDLKKYRFEGFVEQPEE